MTPTLSGSPSTPSEPVARRSLPSQPAKLGVAQHQADRIARACRLIESAATPPPLAALAAAAGLSPHHFHRLFKAIVGVTPRAYAQARREAEERERLAKEKAAEEMAAQLMAEEEELKAAEAAATEPMKRAHSAARPKGTRRRRA